jgi:hypothetical protein
MHDAYVYLAPRERLKKYRQLAAIARKDAAEANAGERESYLRLAEQWDTLAARLEGQMKTKDADQG